MLDTIVSTNGSDPQLCDDEGCEILAADRRNSMLGEAKQSMTDCTANNGKSTWGRLQMPALPTGAGCLLAGKYYTGVS